MKINAVIRKWLGFASVRFFKSMQSVIQNRVKKTPEGDMMVISRGIAKMHYELSPYRNVSRNMAMSSAMSTEMPAMVTLA